MHVTTATKLPLLMACNGSRLMPPSVPQEYTDAAERTEGDAAHEVAKLLFEGAAVVAGQQMSNGVFVTDDMLRFVNEYLSALTCGQMEVETSFGCDEWRVNARADHVKYDALTNTLYIDDFKYGFRIVEVQFNWTLIAHAIGMCLMYNIRPQKIIFTIHQPRPHHWDGKARSWVIDYNFLMQLYASVSATMANPRDDLSAGPHCGGCYAIATCPAAAKSGYNAIDAIERAFSDEIANDDLGRELDLYKSAMTVIKNRYEALQELAQHRLQSGQIIDGKALEKVYGNRKFKSHVTPELARAITGVDCTTAPKLGTPAEVERRGVKKEILEMITERPLSGVRVISVDADRRARKLLQKEG